MIDFSDEEKIRMFDEITEHFYNRNFGTFSKSDFDLLMFHFYLNNVSGGISNKRENYYKRCSDYSISKELGITQQRVRNLKIKENLVYPPIDYDWKTEFASLVENARLDDNKIIISISNPNLYIEIENFLEENGSYIEKQLNRKLMVMRIEFFIDLCLLFEEEKSRKQVIKEIKKLCKAADVDMRKFDDRNVGKSLLETTANVTSIVANVSSCFSPGNILFGAITSLFA